MRTNLHPQLLPTKLCNFFHKLCFIIGTGETVLVRLDQPGSLDDSKEFYVGGNVTNRVEFSSILTNWQLLKSFDCSLDIFHCSFKCLVWKFVIVVALVDCKHARFCQLGFFSSLGRFVGSFSIIISSSSIATSDTSISIQHQVQ